MEEDMSTNESANLSSPFRGTGEILVTGGTGFIGAYILKNLVEKGYSVQAIRRTNSSLPFFIPEQILNKIHWIEGDILDVTSLHDAMQEVDTVIHSAAIVSFHKKDRKQMYKVNVEGTTNVVNVALENNIKRFLHVSSVAALGRTLTLEKVNEEKTWEENKTNTHYAITKRQAELEVWRGFGEGLSGVIINPSTVLGFGNWHSSSSAIFKKVYNGISWYTEGVNGFVGVEDVAEVAVRLLQSDISEKRFIVNADNWSFRQLIDCIADGFGRIRPSRKATPFLGEIVWRLEAFRSLFTDGKPLLSRESARVAHSKTEFENLALLKAVPQFNFTPLEQVIKKACKQYKEAILNQHL
jgi:nucleoside-diphosphate-sugar epimerase